MANENLPLSYKGHPLRRKDNLIYYGTMAEKYIIMLQILSSKDQDRRGGQGVRPAPAHRPRPEEPGPGGEKEREGQPLRRDGRGFGLAGTGAGQ